MPKPISTEANPFIISTGPAKPQSDARKLIRSHVMLGKNKGRTLPTRRPRRPAKSAAEMLATPPDSSSDECVDSEGIITVHELELIRATERRQIPQKVGSELSLITFADDVDPYHMSSVLKFSALAKRAKYPLAAIMSFDPAERQSWLGPLFSDAAYMHTLIYSTRCYFDSMVGLPGRTGADPEWNYHLSKALVLLRERISAGEAIIKLYRTTVYSVISLVVCAHLMGDVETAERHMIGLRTIVGFTGGVAAFRQHCKLMLEMVKCDLALALYSGHEPYLFSAARLEPLIPFPVFPPGPLPLASAAAAAAAAAAASDLPEPVVLDPLPSLLHPNLAETWRVLHGFARHVNAIVAAHSSIAQELIWETMASTMYRLMFVAFPAPSLDETARLALLMFCSRVFLSPDTCTVPRVAFAEQFRAQVTAARAAGLDGLSTRAWVWIGMLAAVSPYLATDTTWIHPWLKQDLRACGIESWEGLHGLLSEFMWADVAFDAVGRKVFATLNVDEDQS